MTALRQNPRLSLRVSSVVFCACASLLYGCLGGPADGPHVGWGGQNESSSLKLTADDKAHPQRGVAGAGGDMEGEPEAVMEDEPSAPVDDPQPPAPRPDSAPSGASSDDSVRCGDGVLDADEVCDIAIADGEDGACVTDCGDDPCAKLDVHGCMTSCVTDTSKPECVD
jgi:hypothetical protein